MKCLSFLYCRIHYPIIPLIWQYIYCFLYTWYYFYESCEVKSCKSYSHVSIHLLKTKLFFWLLENQTHVHYKNLKPHVAIYRPWPKRHVIYPRLQPSPNQRLPLDVARSVFSPVTSRIPRASCNHMHAADRHSGSLGSPTTARISSVGRVWFIPWNFFHKKMNNFTKRWMDACCTKLSLFVNFFYGWV